MAGIDTVLIIEDDPVQQQVINAYFKKRDVSECLVANDGEEAIELIKTRQTSIGLITCDLNMPEKDGIEFLDFLRSTKNRMPIVIITSAPVYIAKSAQTLAKAYGINLFGVVRKPPQVLELNRVLAPLFR